MHIKLDFKIFLFMILFFIMRKIEIYAVLMLFGLIHEMGHLICGIVIGLKPDRISVLPYGFSLGFKVNYDDYNKRVKKGTLISVKKIIIYIAGPLLNIIIAILMLNITGINSLIRLEIIYTNIFIAIFNLLPIYPMDGGRITFEIIHILCGLKKGYELIQDITWITLILLTIASSFMVLYFKNIFIGLTIIYLWILVINAGKYIKIKEEILENVGETMQK